MGRKMKGKDGLNSWVKIFKENSFKNWWKKCSGKFLLTHWVDKLGDNNGWKNCVEKLCEKIW